MNIIDKSEAPAAGRGCLTREIEKIVVEEWCYFPELYKPTKAFEDLRFENFRKFSQNFQRIVFFVQSRKKLTNDLLNSFEKYAKLMHFSQFSSENFRKFSQKFPALYVFPLNPHNLNAGFV